MKTSRLRTGALASLAGLAALIMLSADVQMYFWSQDMYCENSDRDGCNAPTVPAEPQSPTAPHQSRRFEANGNAAGFVISSRTGARARVGIRYAARFQAYIDDLENNHGARVLFMGGIRPGSCSPSSEHPCGKALDVCQLRRGVVDQRRKLPARAELGRIAASHGLFEGGRGAIPTMAMRRSTRHGPAGNRATASRGKKRSNKSNWRTPGRLQLAV